MKAMPTPIPNVTIGTQMKYFGCLLSNLDISASMSLLVLIFQKLIVIICGLYMYFQSLL